MVKKLELNKEMKKIINKGADVVLDKHLTNKYYILSLRIPCELNDRVNELLKNNFGMSKTSWIMQAILDKVRREENEVKE